MRLAKTAQAIVHRATTDVRLRRSIRYTQLAMLVLTLTSAFVARLSAAQTPEPRAGRTATGIIRGRVTDSASGLPISGSQVSVVGTRLTAFSGADGRYHLRGLGTSSPIVVRVLRLGYQPATRTVQVSAGADTTLDVALQAVITTLDAVVTTATGDQSRRSFGNVVSSIRADSVVANSSIGNVNELLQARVPGVQVLQGAGQVGSYGTIRIRGTSSLSLTNEPLIIVDGIRTDNNIGAGNQVLVNNSAAINPEEIESVDILKGPSAAALYGTAAANGVLVIKTKRGQSGATRWNVNVESGQISQPAQFFDNYRAWGRNIVN
ncbi:MAG: TonB-dependent receptor plug domain-containing protein, partial [Phycisphaerae bacterium]|nr:TonB-dependent receptor plug domain-containing protein [Gemmatimonadaceae bacterium]